MRLSKQPNEFQNSLRLLGSSSHRHPQQHSNTAHIGTPRGVMANSTASHVRWAALLLLVVAGATATVQQTGEESVRNETENTDAIVVLPSCVWDTQPALGGGVCEREVLQSAVLNTTEDGGALLVLVVAVGATARAEALFENSSGATDTALSLPFVPSYGSGNNVALPSTGRPTLSVWVVSIAIIPTAPARHPNCSGSAQKSRRNKR